MHSSTKASVVVENKDVRLAHIAPPCNNPQNARSIPHNHPCTSYFVIHELDLSFVGAYLREIKITVPK